MRDVGGFTPQHSRLPWERLQNILAMHGSELPRLRSIPINPVDRRPWMTGDACKMQSNAAYAFSMKANPQRILSWIMRQPAKDTLSAAESAEPEATPAPSSDQARGEPVPDVCQPGAEFETVEVSRPDPVDATGLLPACAEPGPNLSQPGASLRNDPVMVTPINFESDDLDWDPELTAAQQVAVLIPWLQDAGFGGRWVASRDLEYAYERLAVEKSWKPHPWNMIAKEILRANGRKKRQPRNTNAWAGRPRVYFIPHPPGQ